MISKQKIVDTAFRKMGMGRGETLTGFSGADMADALQELEDMMAEWEGGGWQLFYQFAVPTDSESDAKPLPGADSMIDRQWLNAVASNLGVRLCPLFDMSPSSGLAVEASNGQLALEVAFTKVPDKASSSGYSLKGSGNFARKFIGGAQ